MQVKKNSNPTIQISKLIQFSIHLIFDKYIKLMLLILNFYEFVNQSERIFQNTIDLNFEKEQTKKLLSFIGLLK